MALRAANGLLDGVTALLVLLAVVWSGYALWDNSRVYAAADNVQAGLLAFKPRPQEDNSLSFGQLRDINPDVCGWLTLDGTAIDYPVVQGESNFTYLNTDVYGSFALAGSIFLDVDCDADFSGRYSLLYGHHMENGRMFGDLDKYKDGAFFRQNTTGTLTLPGGSYRLEVLACLVVPASEQAIFAPGKWRSDAGGLLPFVEENALQMDAQALRALEEEPEGAQFLAMATCSGEYTDARTVCWPGWNQCQTCKTDRRRAYHEKAPENGGGPAGSSACGKRCPARPGRRPAGGAGTGGVRPLHRRGSGRDADGAADRVGRRADAGRL